MLQISSHFINIKLLMARMEQKRSNDAVSIGIMAYSGIRDTQLIPELCRLLQHTMNLAECGFFWSDHHGKIADAWCTTPHFFGLNASAPCAELTTSIQHVWPNFTENVLIGAVCGYLLPFQTERFYTSQRYQSVYQPIGVKHLLDVVLHDGKRPYGAFLLMRNEEQGPFTLNERYFLQQLIPTLMAALQTKTDPVCYSDQMTTGFAMIARDGDIHLMDTHAASFALALACETPHYFDQLNLRTPRQHLNRVIEPHWRDALASTRHSCLIENRWGRFNLNFEQQHHSSDILLRLSKYTPLYTHLITKLHRLNLPPMRQMVAWLLLLNYTRQKIAVELGITEGTVTSHIKILYAETNTQSSHDLLLKLITKN